MDPLSLLYFALILPAALAYATYVIIRFRGRWKAQIKTVKADDLAAAYDYDISNEKPIPASDMREKE